MQINYIEKVLENFLIYLYLKRFLNIMAHNKFYLGQYLRKRKVYICLYLNNKYGKQK